MNRKAAALLAPGADSRPLVSPIPDLTSRKVLLTVEYDGTHYHGWQSQPSLRTVEGELREAVKEALGHPAEIEAASRTDSGVHAAGQAAAFVTGSPVPTARLPVVLNARLPQDVRALRAQEVSTEFHPRFDAAGKVYRYTFFCRDSESVFWRRCACRIPRWPVVEPMRRAAACLVGEHDFRSFQGATKQTALTTVRRILAFRLIEQPPFLHLYVVGTAFLYKMVRNLAGTLLEVGLERRSAESVAALLASRDRRRAGPTLQARGLCLVRVCFSAGELEQMAQAPEQGDAAFTAQLPGAARVAGRSV
jgi:tRNA pseudouridine38-40 synthase